MTAEIMQFLCTLRPWPSMMNYPALFGFNDFGKKWSFFEAISGDPLPLTSHTIASIAGDDSGD